MKTKKYTTPSANPLAVFVADVRKTNYNLARQIKELAYLLDSMGNRNSDIERRLEDLEKSKRGITLRQWLAGQALLCGAFHLIKPGERIAWAFRTADEMIAFEKEEAKHAAQDSETIVGAQGEGDSSLAPAYPGPRY